MNTVFHYDPESYILQRGQPIFHAQSERGVVTLFLALPGGSPRSSAYIGDITKWELKEDSDAEWETLASLSDSFSHEITGLSADTEYRYQARAHVNGVVQPAANLTIRTPPLILTADAALDTARRVNETDVELVWRSPVTALAADQQWTLIPNYRTDQRRALTATYQAPAEAAPGAGGASSETGEDDEADEANALGRWTATVDGLEVDRTHRLIVQGKAGGNYGPKSNWTEFLLTRPLEIVTQIDSNAYPFAEMISITMYAWITQGRHEPVDSWEYSVVPEGSPAKWLPVPGLEELNPRDRQSFQHNVTGLTNRTRYACQVRAVSASGHSNPSAVVIAEPRSEPAPFAPRMLQASDGGSTDGTTDGAASAVLSWEPPWWGYNKHEVQVSTDTQVVQPWAATANAYGHTIAGLTANTAYQVAVRAANDGGPGPEATASVTPSDQAAVQSLAAVYDRANSAVNVTWSAAGTDSPYEYRYRKDDWDFGAWIAVPTGTSVSVALARGWTYTFEVRPAGGPTAATAIQVPWDVA